MTPVDIALNAHSAPGTRKVIYAEHQPQYIPLPALVTPDGRVTSRWKLEPNDLLLIQNGADVYLTLLTFNAPLQPIMLSVGPPDTRCPRGDVDYDDQPPNLTDEEDPRQPDRESVEHDREVRDNTRLEAEVRGAAQGDNERADHSADVRGGQRREIPT